MTGKKISESITKPTRKRLVGLLRFAKAALKFRLACLSLFRAEQPSTAHRPAAPVRVALTDADIARIEEICAHPPAVTEHMRTAIERNRRLVRA